MRIIAKGPYNNNPSLVWRLHCLPVYKVSSPRMTIGWHPRCAHYYCMLVWSRVVQKRDDMMTSSNGNIFRVTGHLCGEFTGEFKGQWRGALISSLICVRINGWVNNREAGDLRRHRAHYDVIVMHRYRVCDSVSKIFTGVCWALLWSYHQSRMIRSDSLIPPQLKAGRLFGTKPLLECLNVINLTINFIETFIKFQTFSLTKLDLKISSTKWRPICFALSVSIRWCWNNMTVNIRQYQSHFLERQIAHFDSISSNFVLKRTIGDESSLVQVMARRVLV